MARSSRHLLGIVPVFCAIVWHDLQAQCGLSPSNFWSLERLYVYITSPDETSSTRSRFASTGPPLPLHRAMTLHIPGWHSLPLGPPQRFNVPVVWARRWVQAVCGVITVQGEQPRRMGSVPPKWTLSQPINRGYQAPEACPQSARQAG